MLFDIKCKMFFFKCGLVLWWLVFPCLAFFFAGVGNCCVAFCLQPLFCNINETIFKDLLMNTQTNLNFCYSNLEISHSHRYGKGDFMELVVLQMAV